MDLSVLLSTESLIALLTLLALEIVLGIDNVIFIAILSAKLPESQQATARTTGIALAVITRILLLFSISAIMRMTVPLFDVMGFAPSGRDLILLIGGLFLIGKSTYEIHEKLEIHTESEGSKAAKATATFAAVVAQVVLIDIVFSLDSVITAVGVTDHITIMVIAVLAAAAVMITFAGAISRFVERNPAMKILALAFLILIGFILVIEGVNHDLAKELHIKNYAYFAMAFSVLIEVINMRYRRAQRASHEREPVKINQPHMPEAS